MTLPSSGLISMGDLALELGLRPGSTLTLNDPAVRSLINQPTGPVDLNTAHGKSANLGTTIALTAQYYNQGGGVLYYGFLHNPGATVYFGSVVQPYFPDAANTIYCLSYIAWASVGSYQLQLAVKGNVSTAAVSSLTVGDQTFSSPMYSYAGGATNRTTWSWSFASPNNMFPISGHTYEVVIR